MKKIFVLSISLISVQLTGCMGTASRLWDGPPLYYSDKWWKANENCSKQVYVKGDSDNLNGERITECMKKKGFK